MLIHWFTVDIGRRLCWWIRKEMKLLWLQAQAKLPWQMRAFVANSINTCSGLFELCPKGNLKYDSCWKLLVGIVQWKLLWNVLYSVFLNHNWTNNKRLVCVYVCAVFAQCFLPTTVSLSGTIWSLSNENISYIVEDLLPRPFRQKIHYIPRQRAAVIIVLIPLFQGNDIITSLCQDENVIFYC